MLHTLPDEVLAKCLAILPHVELLDIQSVCKSWVKLMNAVAHEGKVCVFGIENSPPLALADGVWTGLPSLPDEYCFGYGRKLHNPSASRDPMLGSVPLP